MGCIHRHDSRDELYITGVRSTSGYPYVVILEYSPRVMSTWPVHFVCLAIDIIPLTLPIQASRVRPVYDGTMRIWRDKPSSIQCYHDPGLCRPNA